MGVAMADFAAVAAVTIYVFLGCCCVWCPQQLIKLCCVLQADLFDAAALCSLFIGVFGLVLRAHVPIAAAKHMLLHVF